MTQGASDANHASDVMRAVNQRDDIIQRLDRIESLLVRIANNTSKDGSFIPSIRADTRFAGLPDDLHPRTRGTR